MDYNFIDTLIISGKDKDCPDSLERLARSLSDINQTCLSVNNRISFYLDSLDQKVVVGLMIPVKLSRKKIFHHAFAVYDADKPVSERHVADNGRFISSIGYSLDYRRIKEILLSQGYVNFHNPYVDYIEQRFREHIANK